MDVAGQHIDSEDDVAELVRRQLTSGGVWAERSDYNAVDGLTRAVRDAGELLPAFARAIAELLTDEDKSVRTGAVALLPEVAGEIGAEALAGILTDNLGLFQNKKPTKDLPVSQPDLRWAMLTAIGKAAVAGDHTAIGVLRKAAVEKHARWILPGVAQVDADWLVANTRKLVPRRSLGGIVRHLPTPKHREQLVRALAPWPESERQEVIDKQFWDTLEFEANEIAKLKSIIAGDKA